jgi:hypothetical protein
MVNLPVGGTVTYTLAGTVSASAIGNLSNTATVTAPGGTSDPTPSNNSTTDVDTLKLDYFTLDPCRMIDTQNLDAPIGDPVLQNQETRAFLLVGHCGIPSKTKAISLNVTVTQPSSQKHVRLFPANQAVPTTSSLNYAAKQTRANNAIIQMNPSGEIKTFIAQPASTTIHLIIDVNGYFE